MKNRLSKIPLLNMHMGNLILARNVLVFCDESQELNRTIKRIVIINEAENTGLVVDDLENLGLIKVTYREDVHGNKLWYPMGDAVGLFRKISSEGLISNGIVKDPNVVKAIEIIQNAEKNSLCKDVVTAVQIFCIGKCLIERHALSSVEEGVGMEV